MRTRKAKSKTPKKTLSLPRQRETSIETKLLAVEQEAKLLRYKTMGYTRVEIAAKLGINVAAVNAMWERAFAEFIIDHRKLRDEKFAEIIAGHERMIRKWSLRAMVDEKAAVIVLRARREISRMCGHGNSSIVEHGGVGGGPIVTVNATPMEAARLVREAFGGKVLPFTGMPNAKTG